MNQSVRAAHKSKMPTVGFQVEKIGWLPLFILEVITALFYWKSLHYPFQFDDVAHITKHFSIRHDNPFARWWYNRRWVGDYLNALNFKWGTFNPFVYRATNLAIHMMSGALVYYVVLMLCRLVEHSVIQRYRHFIAFFTTGLFLLHPLQTQAVSYVIQARIEGLASFFILLNLTLFLRYAQSKNPMHRLATLGCLAITTLISCGTKEIFVLAPLLMVLVDYLFLSKASIKNMLAERGWFYVIYGTFFAALIGWYVLDGYMSVMTSGKVPTLKEAFYGYLHNQNNLGNVLTHEPEARITSWAYFMSQFKAVTHYISLVFWPARMSVEYDWRLARSFASADVILPAIFLATLLGAALYSILRRRLLLAGFGFIWFLLVLSPRSSFIPSAELVCDYKTYLAVVGIYMALSALLAIGIERIKNSIVSISTYIHSWSMYAVVTAFILMPLGAATYQRNKVWSASELFWEDCVKKAPGKARVRNNYGVALCEAGKYEEAIKHYQAAIEIDKAYQDPLSNIAVAYTMIGKVDQAIAALEGAIRLSPNYPEAYNNIASIYIDKKELEKAEQALRKALELRPYYGKAFFNMARVCEARSDYEGVFNNLKKASEGDLDTVADVFFKLGQVSFKLQRFEEAVKAFGKVVQLERSSTLGWFNYANALYLSKQYEQAAPIYEKLLQQDDKDIRYINNFAENYFALKQYDKALTLFDRLMKMEHVAAQVLFRIAACHENMKQYDKAKEFLANLSLDGTPEPFRKHVKQEVARLDLQEKLSKHGKISLKELKGAAVVASNTQQAK